MYATGSNSAKRSGTNSRRCSAAASMQSRKLKRAQILLAAATGAGDEEIARSVGVGGSTVYRTKRRFVLGNLAARTERRAAPRSGAASSRAKRKPCWSRPLVPARPRAALVGRSNCWRCELVQPHRAQAASRARRCAGAWRTTTSSRGARTCGAFPRRRRKSGAGRSLDCICGSGPPRIPPRPVAALSAQYWRCWCPAPRRSRCRSSLRPHPPRPPSRGCAPSSAAAPSACRSGSNH